jgi:hypothetical protein
MAVAVKERERSAWTGPKGRLEVPQPHCVGSAGDIVAAAALALEEKLGLIGAGATQLRLRHRTPPLAPSGRLRGRACTECPRPLGRCPWKRADESAPAAGGSVSRS